MSHPPFRLVFMKNQLELLAGEALADTPGRAGVADRPRRSTRGSSRRAERAHAGASAARAALRDAARRAGEREEARRAAREAALIAALNQPHLPMQLERPGRHAA